MVHLRLNDPDTSRNPYINYITSLPIYPDHEEAHHRLQQLAALFKPIMKKHGLQINSFEEYEPNPEFSGRNWNAGENIELVLRRRGTRKGEGGGGGWLPFPLLCYVFSHELAHSFEMNHSSRHAAWTKTFSQECRELQAKGYYGDGLWSAGRRLNDAEWCQGSSDLGGAAVPSSLCGGAWKKGKGKGRTAGRKRKRTAHNGASAPGTTRKKGTPSLHTGAQTARNTELTAGKRRAYVALPGSGSRVDGRDYLPRATAKSQEYKLDENSTFRRRANTNAARDLRAAATMRRINALQAASDGTKAEKTDSKDERDGKEAKAGSSSRLPSLGVFDQADGHEADDAISDVAFDDLPVGAEQEESETEDEQEEEGEDDGDLYDSATDDEADDSAFVCGSTCPSSAGGAGSNLPSNPVTSDGKIATASTSPASAPGQSQRQTMSSGETDAQRQRRMERYRQSLQVERAQTAKQSGKKASGSSDPSSGVIVGEDEEWQTALKDVQRLGASQRRMEALQRTSTSRLDSGDDKARSDHTPVKSESGERPSEEEKSKGLSLSSLPRPASSSAAANPQKKQSTSLKKKGGGGTLLGGGTGAGSGVSRLLALQPTAPASSAPAAAAVPDSETDDEDVVCTGFRKAGQ